MLLDGLPEQPVMRCPAPSCYQCPRCGQFRNSGDCGSPLCQKCNCTAEDINLYSEKQGNCASRFGTERICLSRDSRACPQLQLPIPWKLIPERLPGLQNITLTEVVTSLYGYAVGHPIFKRSRVHGTRSRSDEVLGLDLALTDEVQAVERGAQWRKQPSSLRNQHS